MRARTVLLVLAILVVAGFAAQNWPEFTRPSTLNFGVTQASVPLGLLLLGALAVVLLVFVATTAAMHSRNLVETRQHARALHAQRELAEKAEASRFTDLRQVLDAHLRETRQRESIQNSEMERTMARQHGELRNHLEQVAHALTGRIAEMESRLAPRRDRVETVEPVRVGSMRVEPAEPLRAGEPVVPVVDPRARERF